MKALINRNIPKLEELLREYFEIQLFEAGELNNNLILKCNPEVLVTRSTEKINEEMLKNSKIKYYATATSGFEHIDLEYLEKNMIHCFIASGSNSNSVAEYVICCILEKYKFSELKNRKIGIIGFGNIGSKVAYYCDKIGMRVLVSDAPKWDNNYKFPQYVQYRDIDEIIEESDVLTVHVPLNKEGIYNTKNLIAENMKSFEGNLFINSSRGGIANEEIIERLHHFELAIDVYQNEPNFRDSIANRAFISTPHIAGHSINAKLNASYMIANDISKFFNLNLDYVNELNDLETITRENSEKLCSKMIEERQIRLDSNFVKDLIGKSVKEKITFFKEFRSDYPIRFETIKALADTPTSL